MFNYGYGGIQTTILGVFPRFRRNAPVSLHLRQIYTNPQSVYDQEQLPSKETEYHLPLLRAANQFHHHRLTAKSINENAA